MKRGIDGKRVYTWEIFRDYTMPKARIRVHCGTFEENRDTLSPAMMKAGIIIATNKSKALKKARELFLA